MTSIGTAMLLDGRLRDARVDVARRRLRAGPALGGLARRRRVGPSRSPPGVLRRVRQLGSRPCLGGASLPASMGAFWYSASALLGAAFARFVGDPVGLVHAPAAVAASAIGRSVACVGRMRLTRTARARPQCSPPGSTCSSDRLRCGNSGRRLLSCRCSPCSRSPGLRTAGRPHRLGLRAAQVRRGLRVDSDVRAGLPRRTAASRPDDGVAGGVRAGRSGPRGLAARNRISTR